jgi:hypothetical protein
VPFPDKDLSNDKHHLPLRDAAMPLLGQEHEKQFYKTDISCTRCSGGFDTTRPAGGSKAQ